MQVPKYSEAKTLVHKFLCDYNLSTIDLELAIKNVWVSNRRPNTISKREELIKKKFKEFGGKIIIKQVKASFTNFFTFAVITHDESKQAQPLSRSQREKCKIADQKYKLHQHKLDNQYFNVFIVKDNNSNLILLMFNPRAKVQNEIFQLYSLTTITRHCLERIIERMKLKSVDEALVEIVTSLQWLDCSTRELLGRNVETFKYKTFKRHIPTTNGALLLTNYTKDKSVEKPILDGHLITWIHKDQFFKNQEVTRSDFNFVQAINYILSNPDKEDLINEYKLEASNLTPLNKNEEIIININGYIYPYEKFISALEHGEYLDFIIDFEKNS